MKCWIKRYRRAPDGGKGFGGYFAKHLGLEICPNHWAMQRNEAKMFLDGRKARSVIKKYKLRNCEVEYEHVRTK